MPPPNDNFASATVISGRSGSALGYNTGATDNSVWWKWTAPATPNEDGTDSASTLSSHYFFTTHADISHGATQLTDFDTVLKLHSNETTELSQLIAASSDNYGWSRQSYAICRVVPGTVVYIKITGAGGSEGNIRLVWGQAGRRFVGGGMISRSTASIYPVGVARPSTVLAEDIVNFDGPGGTSFAAGDYIVRYADGAFQWDVFGSITFWASTRYFSFNPALFVGTDTGLADVFFAVEHTGGTVPIPFDVIPKIKTGAYPYFLNPVHAADQARGYMLQFTHGGGTIKLHFKDDDYTDNDVYSTPPTFVLYRK